MRRRTIGLAAVLVAAAGLYEGAQINSAQPEMAAPQGHAATTEGDFVVKDFKFRDGEALAELRLHYAALGSPRRDSAGHLSNAVMLLHGTGGSGAQFLAPQFAGELFGAGQLLGTGDRRSRATGCTRNFRSTTTTIWLRRIMRCWSISAWSICG